jgi:hypothetical protein
MEFEDPRFALSAILRAATPSMIRQIVEEAARSSGATPDDVRAYERVLHDKIPTVLDAVAANDEVRLRTFMALRETQTSGIRPVPPVARVGLLEIGIRLGSAEVTNAVKGRADAARIEQEFETLISQLRGAALAFSGQFDRRRNGR